MNTKKSCEKIMSALSAIYVALAVLNCDATTAELSQAGQRVDNFAMILLIPSLHF